MTRNKQMTLAEVWICEGRQRNDFEQFMVNATSYKIRREFWKLGCRTRSPRFNAEQMNSMSIQSSPPLPCPTLLRMAALSSH
jgi:hypothetical protein